VQIVAAGPADEADRTLLVRRCPECEHDDLVVADTRAAEAWHRRQARHRFELAAELLVLEAEAWLASLAADAA